MSADGGSGSTSVLTSGRRGENASAVTSQDLLQQILHHPTIQGRLTGRQDAKGDEIAWCPFHGDGNGRPPHRPNLRIGPKGYYCHRCKAGGSLQELAQRLGIGRGSGAKELAKTWDYYAVDGSAVVFQKCRFHTPDGKTYGLRRAAPSEWRACPHRTGCQEQKRDCYDGWVWTLAERPCSSAPPRVLYNHPALTALPDQPVHIAEGEKCCDALTALDLLAVCNFDGAGKWRPEYSEALRGREAVIWVDADAAGRDHGDLVARSLWAKATTIKVIDLYPDRADGWDIANWVAERRAGGLDGDAVRAELESVVSKAPEWRPPDQSKPPTSPPTRSGQVGGEVGGAGLPEFTFLALRQRAQEEGFELHFLPFLGSTEVRLICLGYATLIAAYPKGGKTTLLFDLARRWAAEGHDILYVTEEAEIVWKARLLTAPEEGLERIVGVPGLGADPAVLLRRAEAGSEGIVIVDTTNLLGIADGNDSATVRIALTPWVAMGQASGKTCIFSHHTNKSLQGDLKAVAGSHNFAAIVDCVLVLRGDETPHRRVLDGASRVFALEPVMYEFEGGELRLLGDPRSVALEAVRQRCLDALSISPGATLKTSEVREAMDDPKPSLPQVQQALALAAERGEVLRDPPWSDGPKPGATYRWRVPAAPTSPPTSLPLVGGEVGGSDDNTSAASGGQ
jgi:hypothetical protein